MEQKLLEKIEPAIYRTISSMPPETSPEPTVSLDQFRDLLDMLRRTIQGASDLALRVDGQEKTNSATVGVLETLQQNQQRLLEGFQAQSNAQNKLNADLANAVEQLLLRVDMLESRHRQVM